MSTRQSFEVGCGFLFKSRQSFQTYLLGMLTTNVSYAQLQALKGMSRQPLLDSVRMKCSPSAHVLPEVAALF